MTIASRGSLFVIGAARSGTTVLQNALNHSPHIYLLGEADLHVDDGAPNFAARFNAMHRRWRNQETKSTHVPPLVSGGNWQSLLDALARHHRWVGTKIVVNPGHSADWLGRLLDFQAHHFYGAHYLFVFRHPMSVVASYRGMQEASGESPHGAGPTLGNYAETIALFTRMMRTFPNVRAIVHEDIEPSVFAALGEQLGVDLAQSSSYYEASRVRRYESVDVSEEEGKFATQAVLLYDDLRRMVMQGVERPQLEQNDARIDDEHYTDIGSIHRRSRFLADCLGSRSAPA